MPEAQVQSQRQRCAGPTLLGLKVKEGATGRGTQAAPRAGKRQGQGLPPGAPRGSTALRHVDLGPETYLGL